MTGSEEGRDDAGLTAGLDVHSSPHLGERTRLLVLGIGNILMGDEGVGVHVIHQLEARAFPTGVTFLDGGTGGFHLLDAMQGARHVILVDATVEEAPVGSVRCLRPRYSRDYPRTLTAHDIGLKDLLDALYLLGRVPTITLFAVAVASPRDLCLDLTPALAARVPAIVDRVHAEIVALLAGEAA